MKDFFSLKFRYMCIYVTCEYDRMKDIYTVNGGSEKIMMLENIYWGGIYGKSDQNCWRAQWAVSEKKRT